jgi:hypothetical protein
MPLLVSVLEMVKGTVDVTLPVTDKAATGGLARPDKRATSSQTFAATSAGFAAGE